VLRRCLTLLRAAAAAEEADAWQLACLVDRVSLVERNAQVYGTTAAVGGVDRRSAINAAWPMHQSREAHHSAWPHHSP
jgi:hypothetical protein